MWRRPSRARTTATRPRRVVHLSHGVVETGGFRHEATMARALALELERTTGRTWRCETVRFPREVRGMVGHLRLLGWAFRRSGADIDVVVVRFAISSIVRNLLSGRHTVIVVHHIGRRDLDGFLDRTYFRVLFALLASGLLRHVELVCVSPYWMDRLSRRVEGGVPVFLFPNLFDAREYAVHRADAKDDLIYLGQWSSKGDPALLTVADRLSERGYRCFFSSLRSADQRRSRSFDILALERGEFLDAVASARYTVAMPDVDEGWNRVAHESVLLGTAVVGVPRGGLGDLLAQSGSLVATDAAEVVALIARQAMPIVDPCFIERYDLTQAPAYVSAIVAYVDGVP